MAFELTGDTDSFRLMVDRLKKDGITYKFEEMFAKEELKDQKLFKEPEDSPYKKFRALKETLRSKEFLESEFNNDEIRDLSDFLLKNEKYSDIFENWINTRTWDWERKTLPKNSGRLYSVAKNSILKRDGKK